MIISLSGKIGSGKDTVTKIIQILSANPHFTNEAVIKFLKRDLYQGKWENKKWADNLKDIVCLLINCTREQLEDREFKEKELGKEWVYYKYNDTNLICDSSYFNNLNTDKQAYWRKYTHSPRTLLQLLGTETGRKIIHPNIWINSLMGAYKVKPTTEDKLYRKGFSNIPDPLPNWIISDTRFPNEANIIKEYNGILVTIVSDMLFVDGCYVSRADFIKECISITGEAPTKEYIENFVVEYTHESETALDNYKGFDWEIRNTSNLDYLVDEVRRFMEVFKID